MQNFFNNLGFPEQDKAHSRVDAISAYDNVTKTMFLLSINDTRRH